MNKSEVRKYLLDKPGAVEENPFKMGVPVFKVGGKMFALINTHEEQNSINLKYHRDSIQALRTSCDAVKPGYHMNKSNWNTVYIANLKNSLVKEMIDISYDLVFASLKKSKKAEIES